MSFAKSDLSKSLALVSTSTGVRPSSILELDEDCSEILKLLWDIHILSDSPVPFGIPEMIEAKNAAMSTKDRIMRKRRKLGIE